MSPSERLIALHNLNRREEQQQAREVSSLAAFVAIGLFLAAGFIMIAIIGAPVK